MTAYVRVTESGQITIPAALRKKLSIAVGDQLVVTEDEYGQIILIPNDYKETDLDGAPAIQSEQDADDR